MASITVLIHTITRMPPLSVIPNKLRLRQHIRELPFSLFARPLMGGVCIHLRKGSSA